MSAPTYTRLGYTYRDTRGLMFAHEVYFAGAIAPIERDAVLAKLVQPHNRFIASQVGLPDLQPEFWARRGQAGPGEYDHVWCELAVLNPCNLVPAPPSRRLDELLIAFSALRGWDEPAATVALINAYT